MPFSHGVNMRSFVLCGVCFDVALRVGHFRCGLKMDNGEQWLQLSSCEYSHTNTIATHQPTSRFFPKSQTQLQRKKNTKSTEKRADQISCTPRTRLNYSTRFSPVLPLSKGET